MDIRTLYEEAKQIAPWIVEKRRALHRIPELDFDVYETNAYIRGVLDEMGLSYTGEHNWLVSEIQGGHPGITVALRADIDALPVTEPEGCEFRSEHEGRMHACGHDAHTSIMLGAAKLLLAHREELHGNVRLLFQPAEETTGGAEPMVAAGVLKGADFVYGLHVQPYMNVGQMDTTPRTLNASTDEIDIIVHGYSAHAALPEQGIDAVVCASQIMTALQTAVSRSNSPLKPVVLTFGYIQGGTARNIICDEVILKGTLRCVEPDQRERMKRRIIEISEGIGAAMGAKVEVKIEHGYKALINTPTEAERIMRLASDLLGEENVREREAPSMGGEDFSYFCAEIPGAFWHLGCSTQQPAASLHRPDFKVDERCLPIGAAMQAGLVMDRMDESERG